MADLVSVLQELPPDARRELLDFAEFLARKYGAEWPEHEDWLAMSQQSMARLWDNPEDDVYADLFSRVSEII